MSDFLIHMEQEQTETPVSNIFLDEYMPEANGAYVKIYLYLLLCIKSGADALSVSSIADRFEHTENDVHRALAYWEKLNLLRLEHNEKKELSGICLLEPRHKSPARLTDTLAPSGSISPAQPLKEASPPAKTAYSPRRLARFQEQEDIRQLLFISEQYIGRPLNPSEISTILYFYDGLSFSVELIEYLIEYCVTRGHKNLRYMESVALAWHKAGYQTVEQAKKESSLFSQTYFAVLKAFGIKGRNPVESETGYVDKWIKTWGFSLELVLEACGRTMSKIHEPSFEYTDSILNGWRLENAMSLEEVAALDAKWAARPARPPRHKDVSSAVKKASASNRFHNFNQRDYNFAELEQKLINN